jgi:hypothetical protein
MTRRLVRLVMALACLVVAVSCSHPSGNEAFFVGDSITDQARGLLQQRFGVDDTHVIAAGGKTVQDMTLPLQELTTKNPKVVVINLGTNDVLALAPAQDIAARLDGTVGQFRDARCVLVVTINEHMVSPQGGDPQAIAAELNRTIRGWDGANNRRVIDWAKTVNDYDAAHDPNGPITVDTVHPTGVGQSMLVDDIDRALARC